MNGCNKNPLFTIDFCAIWALEHFWNCLVGCFGLFNYFIEFISKRWSSGGPEVAWVANAFSVVLLWYRARFLWWLSVWLSYNCWHLWFQVLSFIVCTFSQQYPRQKCPCRWWLMEVSEAIWDLTKPYNPSKIKRPYMCKKMCKTPTKIIVWIKLEQMGALLFPNQDKGPVLWHRLY
jgi:hypothetical protein